MFKPHLIAIAVVLSAAGASSFAQNAPASSPAKKELVARILKVQQPGIENMARGLVEQPAVEIMGSAANVLPSRVPREKQEAVYKDIQGDVQKFLDENVPTVQKRAVALAPQTVGSLLEEKFSEDELKQIAATLESPVFVKFQQLGGDMQRVLAEKLVPDTKPSVEPKVRALEQTVAKRLGITPGAQGNGAPAASPAPATGKASGKK